MVLLPAPHLLHSPHHFCRQTKLGPIARPLNHGRTASATPASTSSGPFPSCAAIKHKQSRSAKLFCRAEDDRVPNPFRERADPKKQDAARKALEDMFKGKSDTLAAFDPQDNGGFGSGGGKGRGDGSGGGGWGKGPSGGSGGGSGGSLPNWRSLLSSFTSFFSKRFGELGKALQAILAFAAVMIAFCYLGNVLSAVQGWLTVIFRWVLRLDARQGKLHKPHALQPSAAEVSGPGPKLGAFESSVIAKYGPSASEPAEAL